MNNRKQFVLFEDTKSNMSKIHTGVPQGSILGPLLFLIYINDLPFFNSSFKTIMYADDTTLYSNIEDFSSNNLENEINLKLQTLNSWFKYNKLSLNTNKTKMMIFRKRKQIKSINVKISDNLLSETDHFNFLGIVFNNKLTWTNHTSLVEEKVSKIIFVIRRYQFIYPEYVLKMIYTSLIQSKLIYGLLLWGSNVEKVIKVQKKTTRVVTSSRYFAHTEPLFKRLDILNLFDMYDLRILKFLYKVFHYDVPIHFLQYMDAFNDTCKAYKLRKNIIRTPVHVHSFADKNLLFDSIRLFKNCSSNILDKIFTHSFEGFSKYTKKTFLSKYNVDCFKHNCFTCSKYD